MSSCAQIYSEIRDDTHFITSSPVVKNFQETNGYDNLTLGTFISLCFYESGGHCDDGGGGLETHVGGGDNDIVYLNICKILPSYEQCSFSATFTNDAHVKPPSDEDIAMIRFDASTKIAFGLDGMHETQNHSDGENYKAALNAKMNEMMQQLSTILHERTVHLKPLYDIIQVDSKITFSNKPSKKILEEDFCWVRKFDSNLSQTTTSYRESNVIGCVIGIFSNTSIVNTEQRMNVVPSPLLSLSLTTQNNDGKTKQSQQDKSMEDNQNDILLQQCMKRQLTGKFIILPPRTTCRCTIEINFHNAKTGKMEKSTLEVNEGLPLQKGSSSLHRRYQSNIYRIMPSTRITLHEPALTEFAIEDTNESQKEINSLSLSDASEKTNHEILLIQTIQAIRTCSNFSRYKPKYDCMIDIPRAFLLSGTPGVGKTYSVRKAVEASSMIGPTKLISIRGSELLSNGQSSDAALELNKIFQSALTFVTQNHNSVCLLFMDECDALFSSSIVSASLATILDQMSASINLNASNIGDFDKYTWKRLVVVAATNRIDAIPTMLRRPGRFDRELCIPPPDRMQRYIILQNLLKEFEDKNRNEETKLTDHEQQALLMEIAEICVGYVPSDLAALVRKAVSLSIEQGQNDLTLSKELFQTAMKDVGASALRDSMISAPPRTRWEDIAGDAGGAKTALRQAIEWPKLKRKEFASLGLKPPRGILLHGPPGCAKTTLVRAAAGSVGVAFLALSPADVYASSYVGEAEAVIRRTFSLARSAAPCILFFDEIDTIVGTSNNSSGMDRGSNAEARVLSTFLNEMDGVDGSINDGVLVLGATNRPSTLDSAILRPGRFDRVIYVPPPDQEGRKQIFASQYKDGEIDVEYLSKDNISGSMTGAEIIGACREAAMMAAREILSNRNPTAKDVVVPCVLQSYIEQSLKQYKPLLSDPKILEEYTSFEDKQNRS